MTTPSQWTSERIESLTACWKDGWSASQIARKLGGITRNAVIGKVHRLDLPGRSRNPTVVAEPAEPRKRKTGRKLLRVNPTWAPQFDAELDYSLAPAPIASNPVGLLDLQVHHCRWPLDDGQFCGATIHRGAFCVGHARLAYVPE